MRGLYWRCSQCDSIIMNKGEELKLPEEKCLKCNSHAWMPYETKKYKEVKMLIDSATVKTYREHDTPEKECLQMISDVAVNYDGSETVKGLKGLIDEMLTYAIMGLKSEWPYV